ncbi:Hsp20/alpha crystallin family protein [Ostertagia ostertagi]
MPICILPWTTETEILPTLLDDVFSQFEQFERAASSFPLPSQTERKAETAPVSNLEVRDTSYPTWFFCCNRPSRGQFQVTDEESKLSFSVDVSEFKPDELTVNIDGRTLTVEGKQEITKASDYMRRSLLQRWTLPEDVDVEQIRSTLSENGQLAIEVPKPKPSVTARTIPIRKAAHRP